MDLKKLEYTDFAMQSLIAKRPLNRFVLHNGLNEIYEFLSSEKSTMEQNVIDENLRVFEVITKILKVYLKGEKCIGEIMEQNYEDFRKLIETLKQL